MKNLGKQLISINMILNSGMAKKNAIPDYRFRFGQYKGSTLERVNKIDKKYLAWCYHSDVDLPQKVIKFIEERVL